MATGFHPVENGQDSQPMAGDRRGWLTPSAGWKPAATFQGRCLDLHQKRPSLDAEVGFRILFGTACAAVIEAHVREQEGCRLPCDSAWRPKPWSMDRVIPPARAGGLLWIACSESSRVDRAAAETARSTVGQTCSLPGLTSGASDLRCPATRSGRLQTCPTVAADPVPAEPGSWSEPGS